MQIIESLGIVVGVDWQLYESTKSANNALKEAKDVYYARKITGVECVQGIVRGTKLKNGLRAGALLVAEVSPNALVFHQIDDENYWVCAVRDGIPLSGFDVVADEGRARSLLTEAMSYVQGAMLYGDVPGSASSLAELIKNIPKQSLAKVTFTKKRSPIVVVSVGLGVLALMIALVFVSWHYIKSAEIEENTMNQISLRIKSEQEAARRRAEKISQFKERVIAEKRTFFHAVSPSQQFMSWMNVFRILPFSQNGWKPFEVTCTVSSGSCQIKWMRANTKALPSAAYSLPGDLQSAGENETITLIRVPQLPVTTWMNPVSSLFIRDIAAANTVDQLLSIMINQDLENKMVISDDQEIQSVAIGKTGRWSMTSKNTKYAIAALEKLSLPGVILTEMKLQGIKNGVPTSIVLNGEFHVLE